MGMSCEVCNQGPMQGVTIYRTTPKGQAPQWRCEIHRPDDKQRDDDFVREICAVIETNGKVAQ